VVAAGVGRQHSNAPVTPPPLAWINQMASMICMGFFVPWVVSVHFFEGPEPFVRRPCLGPYEVPAFCPCVELSVYRDKVYEQERLL
jgi:hypothetical protein